ncbi:fimbrial protein [Providencia sp.]|uniref:fimbrial protein n=1 Tax=Providencia sp. TaxID=589 RepID=UPI003F9D2D1F
MVNKILLSLWIVTYSMSGYSVDLTLSPATITYSNPADAVTDFDLLTGNWNATGNEPRFCEVPNSSGNMTKAVIVSSSPSSGYSAVMEGVTYTIFSSNMPGVGWIMGSKDTNAPAWTPLTQNETQVYPFSGGGTGGSTSFGANIRFAFVKLPMDLSPGSNTFPSQKIADFRCYQGSSLIRTASINVNTTNINVLALSCEVTSAKSVSIPLGGANGFSTAELPPVNGNFGDYSTDVTLRCDSGVVPWMTLTDASNVGNTSNIIGLSPSSTASGVGVQVFYNNESTAKSLGIDSASKGNPNQFQVGNKSTGNGQMVTISLNFKYIRMQESVTPGDANATASVTLSYQ